MNTFSMKNWDEHLASGSEGGPRVAYAHATMEYSGVIEGDSICDYLLYYAGEGYDGGGTTSPSFERFDATVDGRRGTFVVRHEGGFDPKGIWSKFDVVAGSATGELTGLTGSGTVKGTMGEPTVSYTFDYALS
ncbi:MULTISPECIES: DUF3224 domain-containing protein [unclassified Amycolatopsis]|uniref:DUF3224 domain-containing protein n=1 Tax=unclassified Amycolatopsis TaxID=2618356 RepID=UPI001C6A310D|nr:DUF3224 domain-containing protein [Amycolatopsis sp. DSM 110486]QYN25252.1 DUF3224 domain-containing protein [Amycolatopsis sp. DSM 110486]